jgi:acyl CoA:acetate/3-ketoacid CoA transferase alpha subunit
MFSGFGNAGDPKQLVEALAHRDIKELINPPQKSCVKLKLGDVMSKLSKLASMLRQEVISRTC